MADSAYLDGLRLLSRRELSEVQVRARLARKGHDPGDVEDAVSRLQHEGALGDARTAAAIARTRVSLKRFGPRRVRRDIEAAGIDADLAAAHGIAVHELAPRQASLEQAYTDLTAASTDFRAADGATQAGAGS